MSNKWVYTFGNGQAEGQADMKNLLGGKGANLAEMNLVGLPVPAGFTGATGLDTIPLIGAFGYTKLVENLFAAVAALASSPVAITVIWQQSVFVSSYIAPKIILTSSPASS